MTRHAPRGTIGRYELLDPIGRGAGAVVYRARDPELGREVALKAVLLPQLPDAEREAFEERFLAEARLAARLAHPGLVVVHDAGKVEATGALYVVFELVEGRKLSDALAGGYAPDADEALLLVIRMAEALQHAHERGLVHRDLRPSNVILCASGAPKLADLGVARLESSRITFAGARQAFGDPVYMSPEQAVGQRADARSDVFSLGAIAYRLLAGQDAFAAGEPLKVLARVIHDRPLPPSHLRPDVPPGVDDMIATALAKPPKDRYPDARTLAADAEDIRAGRPPRHASGRAEGVGTGKFLRSSPPSVGEAVAGEQTNVHRRSLMRGGAGVAALLLLGGLELLRRSGGTAEAPMPATLPAAGMEPPSPEPPPEVGEGLPSLDDPPPVEANAARIVFDLRHSLRRGTVRVAVDDRTVVERRVTGAVRRSFLGLKSHEGRLRDDFTVAPGRHRIRVTVRWNDSERSRSVATTLRPGTTRRLSARLGGLLKDLSVEWR